MNKALRIQLLVAFLCVALVVYFALLGRVAIAMIASGRAAAVGLGVAVLIMPALGLWAMIATLRAGFAHQSPADRRRRHGAGRAASGATRPTRCSPPCAPRWKTTPTTGGAGIGWPAPTTTPGTAAAPGKP